MKKLAIILLMAGTFVLAGCGDSDSTGFNFIPTPIGDAPVARDDGPFSVDQGAVLTVPAPGVLENDIVNGALPEFPAQSAGGGTVVGNSNGSFTYTPPANFSQAADSFTYFLENSAGISTATVTITVNPADGFFVDAVNGNDSTGDFDGGLPFRTIQAAVTEAGTNQDIVVRPGTYNESVTLLDGQSLLGSGSTLVNAQGQNRPVISGGSITLADGNTVDFVRVENAPGRAIDATGKSGGTVTNCQINTTSAAGSGIIGFPIAGGDWNISSNVITNVSGSGIVFTIEGTSTAVARINNNQITGSAFNAIGFITSNSSNLRAQVTGNTMTGNQAGFTFEVIAGDTSVACFDIEGNTNDDTYRFAAVAADAPTFQVEDFNSLIAKNNNSGVVTTPGGSNPPTPVADGTCGF